MKNKELLAIVGNGLKLSQTGERLNLSALRLCDSNITDNPLVRTENEKPSLSGHQS